MTLSSFDDVRRCTALALIEKMRAVDANDFEIISWYLDKIVTLIESVAAPTLVTNNVPNGGYALGFLARGDGEIAAAPTGEEASCQGQGEA